MNYDRQGNEASYDEEDESSIISGVVDNPVAVEASEIQVEHSQMEESLISGIFYISLFLILWSSNSISLSQLFSSMVIRFSGESQKIWHMQSNRTKGRWCMCKSVGFPGLLNKCAAVCLDLLQTGQIF